MWHYKKKKVLLLRPLLCQSATSCNSVIEECQSSQSDSIKRRDLQKRQILVGHNAQGSGRGIETYFAFVWSHSDSQPQIPYSIHSVVVGGVVVVVVRAQKILVAVLQACTKTMFATPDETESKSLKLTSAKWTFIERFVFNSDTKFLHISQFGNILVSSGVWVLKEQVSLAKKNQRAGQLCQSYLLIFSIYSWPRRIFAFVLKSYI